MAVRFRRPDPVLTELLDRAGANVERASVLLRDLVGALPDGTELLRQIYVSEQDGDRLTHDIIHRLSVVRRGRSPIRAADGHALATALDDIVDDAEQAADLLVLYAIEAPMDQAVQLSDVLVRASGQVAAAVRALGRGQEVAPALVEIHRLENEGDRLLREATAALFASGVDPMQVIRWKDVFGSLEGAIDACETVAHLVEGARLRHR